MYKLIAIQLQTPQLDVVDPTALGNKKYNLMIAKFLNVFPDFSAWVIYSMGNLHDGECNMDSVVIAAGCMSNNNIFEGVVKVYLSPCILLTS